MPSQTVTAASRTKTPRSKIIRRDLSNFLRDLLKERRPLDVISEAQILGYFEQVLFELEKHEGHDIGAIQPKAG